MTHYHCGFNPHGRSLKEVADHWRNCLDRECRAMLANYENIREWFREWHG